jgi:hypothetical protein
MDPGSADFIAARRAALAGDIAWAGHDALDSQVPVGHAEGVRQSARLTSDYRQLHRRDAMDVTPQQVVECLQAAQLSNWVLMGLHGYVGYLPQPRATQDVDVMIPYSQKAKAIKAVSARWPELEKRELSQVVRFLDPGDCDAQGRPRPVIDLMFPWGKFQETILAEHVVQDERTGHRLPTLEAALVSKYAALVSPHRDWVRKQQDAADLQLLIKTNDGQIDEGVLAALAAEVWEGGGREIVHFLHLARTEQPFPT